MQQATAEARADLNPQWQRAFDWVEQRLRGQVVRFARHPRWRPAYYLDVKRDDEVLPVYFRGDRGLADHGVYPLEHEMTVLQVLEKHGIPVPHVFGLCEDPRGIVMERRPGRANLATAESEDERVAVLDEFVDILARMHCIDVAELESLGLERPRDAQALGLGDFDHYERAYRSHKIRPEPFIEYTIRWVRNHVPKNRDRVALLQGDTGQFLFEKGHVTAVIDLELAYLGDPLADLAGLFTRDLSEPLGDLSRALRRYAEKSGVPVDERVVRYHAVRFGVCTPMSIAHLVAAPVPELDLVQYLGWYWVYGRTPIEWIAHLEDVELLNWKPPELSETRASSGYDFLLGAIERIPAEDRFAAYQRDVSMRSAEYLRRADRYGADLEAEDLDETAHVLGWRPRNWKEADTALEELATAAISDAARDADLLRLFHRRCLRQEWLLKPVLREIEDVSFQEFSLD
jgi:aminoglycoside phosphotransferase (APT) family kinase protein